MAAPVLTSLVLGWQNSLFDAGGVEPAKFNIRTDSLAIWTDPFARIHVYIERGK